MEQIFQTFQRLANFLGDSDEFWKLYSQSLQTITHADACQIYFKENDAENSEWKTLIAIPSPFGSFSSSRISQFSVETDRIHLVSEKPRDFVVAHLKTGDSTIDCLCLLVFQNSDPNLVTKATHQLEFFIDLPKLFQEKVQGKSNDHEPLLQHLNIVHLILKEQKFKPAISLLCSEIAKATKSNRVTLAWKKEHYLRVIAMSDVIQPDAKMEAVESIEKTMEECLDINDEITLPCFYDQKSLVLQHEKYARLNAIESIASLPLRKDNEVVAVLQCQKNTGHFNDTAVSGVRLLLEQITPKLIELKKTDKWFGGRILNYAKEKLSSLLGTEKTLLKASILLGCLAFAFITFYKTDYRIEATFILKSESQALLPSPFQGYIQKAFATVGDYVEKDTPLLALDQSQIILRKTSLLADINRYKNESRKFRGTGKSAEMQISNSKAQQSQAELELIQYKLNKSIIRAPFSGYIIEGRHKEHLGAPVKEGDILFRVAKIKPLYAVLEVAEKNIQDIPQKAFGELAFTSQPEDSFPFNITKIEPASVSRSKGNVFLIQVSLGSTQEDWWRPGMTGLAKINIEKKSLLWIFTHELVDVLRLKLWW